MHSPLRGVPTDGLQLRAETRADKRGHESWVLELRHEFGCPLELRQEFSCPLELRQEFSCPLELRQEFNASWSKALAFLLL